MRPAHALIVFALVSLAGAEVAAYERIVSLKPGLTEILFALGQGGRVVGVTEHCQEPPEARALPKIGGYATPNLEKILSLRPDLVVLIPDATPPKVEQALRTGGIETFVLKTTGIRDIYSSIEALARKLDVADRGEDLVEKIRSQVQRAERQVAGRAPLRSLIVVQRRPLIVAGGGTFIDELATRAGLNNIARESAIPYPQFGQEQVIKRQPEVILDLDPSPGEKFWGKFRSLPAVQTGRIFQIPESLFVPGPRLGEALSFLIETVYGKPHHENDEPLHH